MTTTTRLVKKLQDDIDQSNKAIKMLNESIEQAIAHVTKCADGVKWNTGRVDLAEDMLAEIEHDQQSAILESKRPAREINSVADMFKFGEKNARK